MIPSGFIDDVVVTRKGEIPPYKEGVFGSGELIVPVCHTDNHKSMKQRGEYTLKLMQNDKEVVVLIYGVCSTESRDLTDANLLDIWYYPFDDEVFTKGGRDKEEPECIL